MCAAIARTLSAAVDFAPPNRERDISRSSRVSCACGDTIVGKYRLESILAEGGMGRIWTARDQILGHRVAVKLAYDTERQPDEASRLLLEGRAAARLSHRAIVQVLDFGIIDERAAFVVMELLEGEDLRTSIRREGGMSAVAAVRTLLPILDALGHAHSRGVVHLDVKPDNIFLSRTPDGCIGPKLIDFGLAKTDWEAPATCALRVGSPAYMSPAQCRGRNTVDARADLWAFAVVLYETIAGKTPWEAPSWPALLHSIVSDPPPSLICRRAVDQSLWRILQRALEKMPDERWQTSREFAAALASWLSLRSAA
jgi:eukaryotic-like serine/threonine-protein kinase